MSEANPRPEEAPRAATLSEEHQRELKKLFDDADKDGSGTIGIEELGMLAERLGEPLSKPELDYLIKEFDTHDGGSIGWNEFITWWSWDAGQV